jgi:hypothetical protein
MDRHLHRSEGLRPRFLHLYLESEWRDVVNEGPPGRGNLPWAPAAGAQDAERTWAGRTGNWLFVKGGMSVVFLLGLMAFGLTCAVVGR